MGSYLFDATSGVFENYYEYPFVVLVTSIIWLGATFMTQPESKDVLRSFYKRIQPGGPGWTKVVKEAKADGIEIVHSKEGWSVPSGIVAMLLGCVMIYSCMFATGYWIYRDYTYAVILTGLALVSAFLMTKMWTKIKSNVL